MHFHQGNPVAWHHPRWPCRGHEHLLDSQCPANWSAFTPSPPSSWYLVSTITTTSFTLITLLPWEPTPTFMRFPRSLPHKFLFQSVSMFNIIMLHSWETLEPPNPPWLPIVQRRCPALWVPTQHCGFPGKSTPDPTAELHMSYLQGSSMYRLCCAIWMTCA